MTINQYMSIDVTEHYMPRLHAFVQNNDKINAHQKEYMMNGF